MEERLYTTNEAAEYLGITPNRVYGLRETGALPAEITPPPYKGGKYRFRRGDLDKWKNQKQEDTRLTLLMQEEEAPPVIPSSEDTMHKILIELYAFLKQFEYNLGITAMRRIEPGAMELWVIETQEIDLHVVTEMGNVHVISPQNQKFLEQLNSELLRRLKAAETVLAFMRKHPTDFALTEYSEEILVQLEPREGGFLLTCKKFPTIAAVGPTEEEVIRTFKGLLFGYAYHLRTHEEELTPSMRELFINLKGIRAEV